MLYKTHGTKQSYYVVGVSIMTSLADCDIMRSRTSCEVAEEAKENWFFGIVENSSEQQVSSGIVAFGGLHEERGG